MINSFSITDFGAEPGDRHINTAAIQETIDACAEAGGGRVVIPPGRYVAGSFYLKSNVELFLSAGAVLQGSSRVEDYREFSAPGLNMERPPEGFAHFLIGLIQTENSSITGPGKIDARGEVFFNTENWKPGDKNFGKPDTPRPRPLMCCRCTDLRIEDCSFTDSPNWNIWLMQCERVKVRGIRISGDWRMNNQDGIDIDGCRDVLVTGCFIRSGDDCLVLRAMQRYYDTPAVCENVVISGCTLESGCQAVRVGCPGDNIVRNCALSDLIITNTRNGIRFDNPKRYLREEDTTRCAVHDIQFQNIILECRNIPIGMNVEEGIALTRLSDISFSRMRIKADQPVRITGNGETIIRDISFSDISFSTSTPNPFEFRNVRNVTFESVQLAEMENPAGF